MGGPCSDIAVIGGGVIGLCLARALMKASRAVTVIDAGAEAPPATAAAAGMLAPSFEDSLAGDALYAFSRRSLSLWPDFAAALEEETGIGVDYRAHGILGVALNGAQGEALAKQLQGLCARGGNVSLISGEAARALEPALSPAIVAGLHAPDDAQLDPVLLLRALRASLKTGGATMINGRAAGLVPDDGGWLITLANGEALRAGKAIVASGVGARQSPSGAPGWPIHPVKGDAFALETGEAGRLTMVVRGPGAYLCPKSDGRLVIGASEAPGRRGRAPDPAAIDAMKQAAATIAPATADWRERGRWSGLRPATPDGAPLLGEDPRSAPGLYAALGHYRNGVLLAPASAAALAEEIASGVKHPALSDFRPDRAFVG